MCNYLGNIDLPDKAFSRLTSLLHKVKPSAGVCVSYFSLFCGQTLDKKWSKERSMYSPGECTSSRQGWHGYRRQADITLHKQPGSKYWRVEPNCYTPTLTFTVPWWLTSFSKVSPPKGSPAFLNSTAASAWRAFPSQPGPWSILYLSMPMYGFFSYRSYSWGCIMLRYINKNMLQC